MTINELFWAAAFGAAGGVAGVTALMGILSWAWRRVALWGIDRKLRQEILRSCPSGHGEAPPTFPAFTEAEVMKMVQAMGAPLPGASAGVRACYEGPARVVGTLIEAGGCAELTPMVRVAKGGGAFPGAIGMSSLPDGEVVFVVRVVDSPADVCPCCRNPLIVAGSGGRPVFPPGMPPDSLPGPGGGDPGPGDPLPPASAS